MLNYQTLKKQIHSPLDVDDSTSLKCLIVPDNIDAISGKSWTIIIVKHFYFTRRYVAKISNNRINQTLESGATSWVLTSSKAAGFLDEYLSIHT